MEKEKQIKERLKVLEKIIKLGYDTDKKIIDMKLEDLIKVKDLNRSDLTIIVGIKTSLKSNNLIAFLCGINEKGGQ